jgi:hypothetical protein
MLQRIVEALFHRGIWLVVVAFIVFAVATNQPGSMTVAAAYVLFSVLLGAFTALGTRRKRRRRYDAGVQENPCIDRGTWVEPELYCQVRYPIMRASQAALVCPDPIAAFWSTNRTSSVLRMTRVSSGRQRPTKRRSSGLW